MNLLELYKQLSNEEKEEFISLIVDEIKKAEKTTFLEQYHNSLKATGDKPYNTSLSQTL